MCSPGSPTARKPYMYVAYCIANGFYELCHGAHGGRLWGAELRLLSKSSSFKGSRETLFEILMRMTLVVMIVITTTTIIKIVRSDVKYKRALSLLRGSGPFWDTPVKHIQCKLTLLILCEEQKCVS